MRDSSDSLLARAARSADGIVEAYETDHIMAIQSHPEKMIQQGEEKWLALFREFVIGCK